MKISTIQKKIAVNAIASCLLIFTASYGIYYNIKFVEKSEAEIKKIKSEIKKLEQERSHLESKAAEFKKYSQLWSELPDLKKRVEVIKSDKVNKSVAEIAKKHFIKKVDMKLSLPQKMSDGIFDRATIKVSYVRVDLSFSSLTDIRAIKFINDFTDTLTGQKIISEISISRDKEYDLNDLKKVSTGQAEGNIKTKAIIHWYNYEDK